jgi:hypothetical protein
MGPGLVRYLVSGPYSSRRTVGPYAVRDKTKFAMTGLGDVGSHPKSLHPRPPVLDEGGRESGKGENGKRNGPVGRQGLDHKDLFNKTGPRRILIGFDTRPVLCQHLIGEAEDNQTVDLLSPEYGAGEGKLSYG